MDRQQFTIFRPYSLREDILIIFFLLPLARWVVKRSFQYNFSFRLRYILTQEISKMAEEQDDFYVKKDATFDTLKIGVCKQIIELTCYRNWNIIEFSYCVFRQYIENAIC